MSYDPYQNIYYYYRGPKAKESAEKDTVDDIQLENNTTKALINTLRHCSSDICQDFLTKMFKCPIGNSDLHYLLQTQTIGEQKIKIRLNRILWVICSRAKCPKEIVLPEKISLSITEKSLPDAWIWNNNTVILIESKTNAALDKDQLIKHRELLISNSILKVSHWEEIHSYFIELIKTNTNISDKDKFLLQQFSKYLELVSLSSFNGWNDEDFEFFHLYERDNVETERIRSKMKIFASEVLDNMNLSRVLVDKGLGKLKYPLQNIWYKIDLKDSKYFIKPNVPYVNFTLELFPDAFQVTIVFPNFSSIKKLRNVLNSKRDGLIHKFKDTLEQDILKLTDRDILSELAESKKTNILKIPTFKIKIYSHLSIIRENRRWIPRNEFTLDLYTIEDAYWFDLLKNFINLYHPAKGRKKHWGAGLHILKQYKRGCELLSQPNELIADIQDTLQKFINFVEALL